MKFVTHLQKEEAARLTIGGKARNLYRLRELGFTVPAWIVIPSESLEELIPDGLRGGDFRHIADYIRSVTLPRSLTDEVCSLFPEGTGWAVRSSGADEDGLRHSFAGQFETELFVNRESLAESIRRVWSSAFSERVYRYRKDNHLPAESRMAVIIQEMISPYAAGVAFGINPVSGDEQSKMVTAVYGIGEGLVSGELDADHYLLKGKEVISQIACKTHRIVPRAPSGIQKTEVEEALRNKPALTAGQIHTLGLVLDTCNQAFGGPQDIEFAVFNDQVYLLQVRPVTAVFGKDEPKGEYIVWDNSNIIESYPGVTTPLTFSFISKSYESAYRQFCRYMGVSEKVIKANERVFANTLGLISGRVYYNLRTWYRMLALLPGYNINARYMERMMGVRERFDVPESSRLSKTAAWWGIARMVMKMFWRFIRLSAERRAFMKLLDTTIGQYKEMNLKEKDVSGLMNLYLGFENLLLHRWKAPLLNDFFAMIWFGLLQKRCAQYRISRNPNIHNDLLCGSSDIISTQPIHRSMALSAVINANPEIRDLFLTCSEKEILDILTSSVKTHFRELKKEIDSYIRDFGERCIGELKLETVSYSQDPSLFIRVLKSYVQSGITSGTLSGTVENDIREKAEKELAYALRNKPLKKWMLRRTLLKARELVSARENLRYERTRAFGIVRELFLQIGIRFHSQGIIEQPSDVFYLTKEEIFSFIEGTAVTQDLKALSLLRKAEFEEYRRRPAPPERFSTTGTVCHGNDYTVPHKMETPGDLLKGIGCCPGKVRGKVCVILDPQQVSSLNGDILVTSSTDPGWVTLFPGAAAVIVERGSLLSHSAIVSREMGKPCIVGVTGLLRALKTGDEIEMDGSTGEIKRISRRG